MRRTRLICAALCMLAIACGKEPKQETGELGIIIDADSPQAKPGEPIDIPFTITGVEGATIKVEATAGNPDFTVSARLRNESQGEIKFTAPAIVKEEGTVKVTLTATDKSHNREASESIDVKVVKSPDLTLTALGEVKTVAVKPNGTFSLQYKIENLGAAQLKDDIKVTLTQGWTGTASLNKDKITVNYTAPATPGDKLSVSISASDNFQRTATYSTEIEIVTFTPAENASNCHIVKPGSTITINAVKGNSSKKLSFDNAALLWQDAKGMVKSVGGNGTEGVIVVALNSGREGNAVIVARDGDKVVWSWHLWVTNFDPDAEPFVWKSKDTEITYTWMDRNLGAMSCEKYNKKSLGLLYQWGRKDPFTGASDVESNAEVPAYDIDGNPFFFTIKERPVYGDHKTTNLQLAIETPDVFYTAPSSAWPVVDWLTDDATLQDHDLWGGVSGLKSVYDPCPEGWIMPASGDCWGFRKEYKKDGKLTDDAKYYPEYPWYIEYEDAYCIGFRYKTESGKEYWFPFSGKRDCDKGTISGVGSGANYNTRTASSTTVMQESFAWGNPATEFSLNRPYGAGVRCIKETK